MGSFWQTTCDALQLGVEPGWEEVYAYREPLALLIAARYPRVASEDREDLVEEILLEIKDRLFSRYLPERGPFRRFLCGVARNRVLACLKRRRKHVLVESFADEEVPAPSPEDGECIDLAAELLGAARRWSERQRALEPLEAKVLAAHLFEDHSQAAVADREGLPLIKVKRLLASARLGVLAELLERTLRRPSKATAGLAWRRLARTALDVFARPRDQHRILRDVADPELREAMEVWLDEYRRALRAMPGAELPEGGDLVRGMRGIFGV